MSSPNTQHSASDVRAPRSERDERSYVNEDMVDILRVIECFRGVNDAPLTIARVMFITGFKRDKTRRALISGKAKGWIKEVPSSKERLFIPGPRAIHWAAELAASAARATG